MIKFDKPVKLNGVELLTELNAAGIKITTPPTIDGNGNFWLDIAAKDEAKVKSVVSVHNGTTVPPDNSAAKSALLAKLGITDDEAKLLLS